MQEIHWNESSHILRKFENEKDDFHVTTQSGINIKFWTVIKNSEISFLFDADRENTNIECFFLIPAIKYQTVKLNIQTNFKAKDTKILINVIALASDNASITLDGNLHVEKNINNVEARLYEETLLLGNAKYISLIPWLRVDAPDVIASHWAKIQRISPERIFYMQSRWLPSQKAINMIINSYSEQIVDKLQFNEKEKEEFYSMIQ